VVEQDSAVLLVAEHERALQSGQRSCTGHDGPSAVQVRQGLGAAVEGGVELRFPPQRAGPHACHRAGENLGTLTADHAGAAVDDPREVGADGAGQVAGVPGAEIGGVAAEQRAGGVDRVTGRRAGVRSEIRTGDVDDGVGACRRRQGKATRGDEQQDEQCASHG